MKVLIKTRHTVETLVMSGMEQSLRNQYREWQRCAHNRRKLQRTERGAARGRHPRTPPTRRQRARVAASPQPLARHTVRHAPRDAMRCNARLTSASLRSALAANTPLRRGHEGSARSSGGGDGGATADMRTRAGCVASQRGRAAMHRHAGIPTIGRKISTDDAGGRRWRVAAAQQRQGLQDVAAAGTICAIYLLGNVHRTRVCDGVDGGEEARHIGALECPPSSHARLQSLVAEAFYMRCHFLL